MSMMKLGKISPAGARAAALGLALFVQVLSVSAAPSAKAAGPKASTPAAKWVAADLPIEEFPDSSELRERYWDSYFSAPRSAVLARSPQSLQTGAGLFRLSVVDEKEYFYQVISPLAEAAEARAGGIAAPPLYAQGTWILKRSRATGKPIQAKVFLRSDPGTFIRIYPDADRCRMDLVLYGGVMNREVALPLPFDRVFASPFSDIVAWTGELVDWELFSPHAGAYAGARAFVAAVRSRLPELRYVDDGALDAEGRPVYIATGAPQKAPVGLNCSGFAKWIVDGFYFPLTGRYLDPKAMAERHDDLREGSLAAAYEIQFDPFFGLDWTRNLGKAMGDATYPARSHGLFEEDVMESPFALFAAEAKAGAVNGSSLYEDYPAVDKEIGYEARGIEALLYVLALREPGTVYLASLSRKGGGELAGLRRHYHVAVLVPYFEATGEFRVAVFESAAETSIGALMSRGPKDYVHLVRLRLLPDFDPPRL
jgi:hypothetical protein